MIAATLAAPASGPGRRSSWLLAWLVVLAVTIGFSHLPRGTLDGLWEEVPRGMQIPVARWISAATAWLVDDARIGPVAFRDVTRGLAALLEAPLRAASSLLATGLMRGEGSAAVRLLPPLPWLGVVGAGALLGLHAGGARLAALMAACLGYLAVFGQWQSAMTTLASIAIAVPLGVAGGLLLGIAAYRSRRFEAALSPVLDAMQTAPVFAYLLPILVLFGFGPAAALIATVIYAMPPMVRVTQLALRGVSPEIVEYGRMAGATPRQLVWRVMVPSARAPLMVGVNQVIMLSLNMVIIASMIGAGGLGYDVLTSLRRLDIGGGLEAGVAIVVLAVALDRLSQAYAARAGHGLPRSRLPLAALAAAVAAWGLAFLVPAVAVYPEGWQVSTSDFWAGAIEWLNVNYFDTFEAIKTAVLTNLLLPVRRVLVAVPWWWGTFVIALAMWRIGGSRRAGIAAGFALFVAFTGYWAPAMVSIYLVGVSVLIAAAIGVPVGIASGLSPRVWAWVQPAIDTLQTLPSFVYLIPVVMLFRVGEFTALIAIVLYAVAPAIRYTALGVREVDPALIEAATAMGTTPAQRVLRVRLPLAAPEVLLGLSQTVLLAVSMLVITALVGTRDLGQEVYIALTKADVGRGLVAGACIAMLAMLADRMLTQGAARLRRRLGLAP
ncbi:proline/glycine betaine ABC transporter permease [Amaricoccus sp.]|uniref:ABC transporter permease n=1 Tax=Amaricoccus sp. TaxID=1872485 RepID=UPI001B58907D|nr:ABC transporter permease subunit [Amaricoccus sp.]MBP7242469.1 ABC transporter permease subunit [Amaricoccus sp.]